MSLLADALKSASFSVVTDGRVYRRQELLSLEGGVLTTRSFVRVPLSEVRFFFFHGRPKFRKSGRTGRFSAVKVVWNGREKLVEGRILSEDSRWILAELGAIPFLIRRA